MLAQIKAQLDTVQASTLADAKTSYNLSSRAFKVGFANTISRIYLIAIFVALLAFLTTLPMPNLRLPKKGEGPGGEQRGGLAWMEG